MKNTQTNSKACFLQRGLIGQCAALLYLLRVSVCFQELGKQIMRNIDATETCTAPVRHALSVTQAKTGLARQRARGPILTVES